MNVSPAQRLVNYLREFPLVRPSARPASEPIVQVTQVQKPAAPAEPVAALFSQSTIAATPARLAAGPRLPRGSLLNIVT